MKYFLISLFGLLVLYPLAVASYDVYRIFQLLLFAYVAVLILIDRCELYASRRQVAFYVLMFLMAIGTVLQSRLKFLAFAEVCLYILFLSAIHYSKYVTHVRAVNLNRILYFLTLSAVFYILARAIVSYVAAVLVGESLDPWLIISGFDNLRFFGQFAAITMPIIIWPIISKGACGKFCKCMLTAIFVGWWTILIMSGTRGAWLSLALTVVLLGVLGRKGRIWAIYQVSGALAGVVIHYILMNLVPAVCGLNVFRHASSRLTTSLSGRELIWEQALNMIYSKPWLGYGQLHFADYPNRIAAHPHNSVLQWGSEWGVVSLIIGLIYVMYGLWSVGVKVYKSESYGLLSNSDADWLRVCLFASIVSSLTQSLVDGVFVVPYTQTWLIIVVAWIYSIHDDTSCDASSLTNKRQSRISWLVLIVALLYLSCFLFLQLPILEMRESVFIENFGGHYQPRFWRQGIIYWD